MLIIPGLNMQEKPSKSFQNNRWLHCEFILVSQNYRCSALPQYANAAIPMSYVVV